MSYFLTPPKSISTKQYFTLRIGSSNHRLPQYYPQQNPNFIHEKLAKYSKKTAKRIFFNK